MLFVDLVSGECDAAKTCCIAVTANLLETGYSRCYQDDQCMTVCAVHQHACAVSSMTMHVLHSQLQTIWCLHYQAARPAVYHTALSSIAALYFKAEDSFC